MAELLVATLGDQHTCPLFSGKTPHVGGTIISGASKTFVHSSPIARMGDKCICADGSIAIIIQGYANVLVEGQPIATIGCMTSHGGVIATGQINCPKPVLYISNEKKKFELITMPIELMPPFAAKTYTSYLNKIINNKKSTEADKKEEELQANGYLIDVEFSF